ncbi:MAG: methylornithine synthase PylB, partial [Lentihominibacter sp.]
ELFETLRINQSYDERMHAKLYAKEKGMLIEEGLMAGIGESFEDIADSLIKMGEIGASQVRVMSFVPQEGSPMENVETPDRMIELKIIALMRIMYPWALIPTSLDVDGIAGLEARLNAGGNVVTSIIPPRTGLAGVAQNSMDVDDGGRTVEEVKKILEHMGLEAATAEEYRRYIGELKCRK